MTAINEALDFLRNNDWSHVLSLVRAHEVPPLIQFMVYAICGGLATSVYVGVSLGLSHTIIPAMDGMTANGVPLTDGHRARNALINNIIAFIIANAVGYITNVMFVFKTGRYSPMMEFLLFTVGNCVAFLISQFAGPYLIKRFGMKTIHALMTNVLASMLLNFVIRKFIVFKG